MKKVKERNNNLKYCTKNAINAIANQKALFTNLKTDLLHEKPASPHNQRMRNKYKNKKQILHQSQPQNFGTSTCFGKTFVFILRSRLGERGMRVNSW